MKSRNITTIIAEGTDGVGKSSLIDQLFKIYNYRYMVYHRGEISNLFYALKYNRPFAATQNGLPFLHVLLVCDEKELKRRIIDRGKRLKQSKEFVDSELAKVKDQDEFIRLAMCMNNDYHIIVVDTTKSSIEEVGKEVASRIDDYVLKLQNDSDVSEWNKMYKESCEKLGLNFESKDNQPYINGIQFMSELTCQNGVYERFDNKAYPDNLLYSMNYDVSKEEIDKIEKVYDFAYIINSKIKRRPEVYEYYSTFASNYKTCMTSDYALIPRYKYLKPQDRRFGNDFIKTLAKANATVYTARDLAHLKMQTARLYEAIIAKQIVFVDAFSDLDCDILSQIHTTHYDRFHPNDIVELLYVTPETICEKYDFITTHPRLHQHILQSQTDWYERLTHLIKGGKFNA